MASSILMRHQHRYRRMLQDVAGDATQHALTERAMSVASHHQQIGLQVGRRRKQAGAGRMLAVLDDAKLGGNAVEAQ